MKTLSTLVLSFSLSAFAQSENIYKLTDVNQQFFNDNEYAPLAAISNADIIGISESAHNVKDYIKIQTRIIQVLVRNYNYRQIYFESSVFKFRPVAQYIQDGKGDVKTFLKANFQSRTVQFLDLTEWLRNWNINNPNDRVYIGGVDIYEFQVSDPYAVLIKSIENLSTQYQTDLEIIKQCPAVNLIEDSMIDKFYEDIFSKAETITDAQYDQCYNQLSLLKDKIKSNVVAEGVLGFNNYYDVILSAQVLMGIQTYLKKGIVDDNNLHVHVNIRDQLMTDNIINEKLRFGNTQKVIYSAHNVHTSKATSSIPLWNFMVSPLVSTGEHLNKKFIYKNIGSTGYNITGDNKFNIPTSPLSLDVYMHNLKYETALIDTNADFIKNQYKWYVHDENNSDRPDGIFIQPQKHFDFMYYLDTSVAADKIQ